MSHIVDVVLSQGYVSTGGTGSNAYDLEPGELTKMYGAFYRKNDPKQVWKIPGRTQFANTDDGKVKGIAICQFDEGGTDRLIASATTTWYSSIPGAIGTFAPLVTGLSEESERLTACHQDDRWYLGNGYDANRVLMPDGTVRLMGMMAPVLAPTVVATSVITLTNLRPTAHKVAVGNPGFPTTGGWNGNPALAYDPDVTTFASMTIVVPQRNFGETWFGWASDTSFGRTVKITWSASIIGNGIFQLFKSEDGGATFENIFQQAWSGNQEVNTSTTEIAITTDSNLLQIWASGSSSVTGSTFRVYDINVEYGSLSGTTTDGIYYAITEYYAPDNLESPPSKLSAKLTLTAQGAVVVTRPAQLNASATHWRVYRIGDGVTNTIENLGLISGDILIADTTWTDTLEVPITVQATPIIPLVTVGDLNFPRDDPPPPFVNMISWKGSICGISRINRRQWIYSESGRPESFPGIYVVSSFPLDEHDSLVGQMAVGETLVLLCEGALLGLDDIPRVTDGQYNNADTRPLKGHPGCVGNYAYTTFSVTGEPRGAWVSPFGVYVTNGTVCECISTDLSWESEVNVPYLGNSVLRWDAKNLILWLEFDLDGDGLNDREMPFHMAEAHQKQNGKPKIGQPTAKTTSCMASALIDAAYYRFSGDPAYGFVYVEESGQSGVDMVVRTLKITAKKTDLALVKATLIHSDSGLGEQATVITTLYRDSSRSSNSRTSTVSMYGDRGTTFGVGRAGEAVDFQITYSGSGQCGLLGIQAEVDGQGRSGSAPRVTSSSVTP